MKEVIKCSISGIGFTLDADAYRTLNDYLASLKEGYGENPDGDEIVADIEARIAELILSCQENTQVVEKPLIDDIIRQMGSPEQIGRESDEGASRRETPRIPRRLYRDPANAKLGGVCAGLGKYFDVDPVWIRVGIFVPLLLSTFRWWVPFFGYPWGNLMSNIFIAFVLSYIVLWFAIPAARSPRQRLEMKGERITAQSIRETAHQGHDIDGRSKSVLAGVLSALGQIVLIMLKILIGLILFGLILAACGMVIGIFAILVKGSADVCAYTIPAWVGILWITTVLIPFILLIYVLMCLMASRKPGGKTVLTIFTAWLLVCIACATTLFAYWRNDRIEIPADTPPAPTRYEDNLMNHAVDADGDTQAMVLRFDRSEADEAPDRTTATLK